MAGSDSDWTAEKALQEIGFDVSSPLTLGLLAGRLKKVKRQGWLRYDIDAESVADHSYRMAFIALSLPSDIDRAKCIQLCLVHDLAEAVVGDITPMSKIPKAEKVRREALVMDYLAETSGPEGQNIRTLWHEFEDAASPESRVAQDIDKLEMMLQAIEYEKQLEGKVDLGEFMGAKRKLRTSVCIEYAEKIAAEREAFWGDRAHIRGDLEDGGMSEEHRKLLDAYYAQ
ncbi:5'-deoxynucleotidase hdd1 [Paramyrothecium foliicola]|nr:5'-deoxynucleotidase hdd1 [Paramyrothecium foliicola]